MGTTRGLSRPGSDSDMNCDMEETDALLSRSQRRAAPRATGDQADGAADSAAAAAAVPAEPSAVDGVDGVRTTLSDLSLLLAEPTVALLLVASAFRFLAGFTIAVWIVPFYRGRFPGSLGAEFAIIKAAVNGVAGSVSATGGGVLADRLSATDARAQFWVPAAGSLLGIPFWLGTLQSPSLEASLGCLFFEYLLAECWFGPTVTQLQRAAPDGTQGLTTGVFSFLTLIGNLAPFAIGLAVQSGSAELTDLLGPSVCVLYALAAVAFVAAGQTAQATTLAQREAGRDRDDASVEADGQ